MICGCFVIVALYWCAVIDSTIVLVDCVIQQNLPPVVYAHSSRYAVNSCTVYVVLVRVFPLSLTV